MEWNRNYWLETIEKNSKLTSKMTLFRVINIINGWICAVLKAVHGLSTRTPDIPWFWFVRLNGRIFLSNAEAGPPISWTHLNFGPKHSVQNGHFWPDRPCYGRYWRTDHWRIRRVDDGINLTGGRPYGSMKSVSGGLVQGLFWNIPRTINIFQKFNFGIFHHFQSSNAYGFIIEADCVTFRTLPVNLNPKPNSMTTVTDGR